MANIRVIGIDTIDGFDLKARTTDGETREGDLPNTTVQVLRHRSRMFKEMGYFYLGVDHIGSEKRIL